MTYKTMAVGMILFLSSACLPHPGSLPEKTPSLPSSAKEEVSLLAPTESKSVPSQKNMASQEIPPSPEEPPLPPPPSSSPSSVPPPSPSPTERQSVSSLGLPISDEA